MDRNWGDDEYDNEAYWKRVRKSGQPVDGPEAIEPVEHAIEEPLYVEPPASWNLG